MIGLYGPFTVSSQAGLLQSNWKNRAWIPEILLELFSLLHITTSRLIKTVTKLSLTPIARCHGSRNKSSLVNENTTKSCTETVHLKFFATFPKMIAMNSRNVFVFHSASHNDASISSSSLRWLNNVNNLHDYHYSAKMLWSCALVFSEYPCFKPAWYKICNR